MMNVNHMNFNYTDTFSSSDIETGAGYKLGDRVFTSNGVFVMTEASEDLTKGMCLTRIVAGRYSQNNLTITGTPTALPTSLAISDALATVAQGALAGKLLYFNNDEHGGYAVYVKKNTAGANGSAMTIDLLTALGGVIGTNPDIDVIDPDYVEKSAVTSTIQKVVGICPTTVDQSDKPFFWRQVSGVAPVLAGAVIAVGRNITAGDDTEGSCVENTEAVAYDDANVFGSVIVPNTAADKLLVASLHGFLS
jgi:hypothetical protein